jgi:hypothetical protein
MISEGAAEGKSGFAIAVLKTKNKYIKYNQHVAITLHFSAVKTTSIMQLARLVEKIHRAA